MQEVFEKIRNRIESLKTNLGFGGTIQQMYADGMLDRAIEIVNQVAEEYKSQNIDQDLTIVESLPSLYPLQPFEVEAIHRVVERAKYNNGWIPCSERLPKEEHDYLICDDKGNVYSSTYQNNRWLVNFATDEVITWQPLPEPYKPEGE